MKAKIFLIFLVFAGYQISYSQNVITGWNWPEDKEKAENKYEIYTTFYNQGNYRTAVPALSWLLSNCPRLNPSIYINGARIYENLSEDEHDPVQKKTFEDSCLLMFDLRIQYFNDEASVLNRKAFYAYKFKKDDRYYFQELFDLFTKAFELNKNNFGDYNIVPYLDVIKRYKLAGGKITNDQILAAYENLIDIINYKLGLNQNVEKLNSYFEQLGDLLTSIINVDCGFIEKSLLPKLKSDPENVRMAKNIFKLAFEGKCLDSSSFLESAEIVQKHEPNYGLARLIGDRFMIKGDYESALRYYDEALTLTEENTKKAELFLNQGNIARQTGDKLKSREYAHMCLEADPSKKECFNLIGNLYFSSYNDCKQGINTVQDKAIFIAAYEMYQKANNTEMKSKALSMFPTSDEISDNKMEIGKFVKIGCWINEAVRIQKHD